VDQQISPDSRLLPQPAPNVMIKANYRNFKQKVGIAPSDDFNLGVVLFSNDWP